ncbi:PcfB family protein [Gemella sp. zg-570]|uniref:PcfB family protein n=1 Tax=unclassified Gemella TaxID=2624949 RepID=UPI001C0486D7|nr:PcfB family protein [Gemella sp. zg-570]MBU0279166.1 PcfB family protein [Gemella sp. zg-1178]QWQ38633.1 PcfB family protein [Gemella sp. zg-570]
MINEELTHKLITIETKITKATASEVIKALKLIVGKANKNKVKLDKFIDDKFKSNAKPLSQMVKKGQLESLNISKGELKELKKLLNRYGVNFSVMKDKETKEYSVFYQAKDTKVMEKAFTKAIKNAEKKHDKKESTIKKIKEFQEKSKAMFSDKDKIKNKQKEQSL